jgi:hypothetical protein
MGPRSRRPSTIRWTSRHLDLPGEFPQTGNDT